MPVDLGKAEADGTLTGRTCRIQAAISADSGFIQTRKRTRTGSHAGCPLGTTRIRITFPKAGTYQYHCALHDVDGMLGTVVVLP